MPAHNITFRPARREDANVLAELVNFAGEGLPLYLWSKSAAPCETPWDVGRKRAARDEGSFSFRNATMVEYDGEPAGCLIGYEIAARPGPVPPDMPAMFVPLQELENKEEWVNAGQNWVLLTRCYRRCDFVARRPA